MNQSFHCTKGINPNGQTYIRKLSETATHTKLEDGKLVLQVKFHLQDFEVHRRGKAKQKRK